MQQQLEAAAGEAAAAAAAVHQHHHRHHRHYHRRRHQATATQYQQQRETSSTTGVLDMLSRITVLVAVCAGVLGAVLHLIREPALSDAPSVRSAPVYNLVALRAPALSGPLLRVFAWIATRSPLRPVVARALLNDNGMHLIRELASAHPNLAPVYFPMARLSTDEHRAADAAAAASLGALASGLGASSASGARGYNSVSDFHALYASGRARPSEVLESVLTGCERLAHLRVFSSLRPDDVRRQARESDRRWAAGRTLGVWDGVPVAVKDMVEVAGSVIYDGGSTGVETPSDDVLVARLRQAGAIVLGVTVMTEGGTTPLGFNAHFGGPFNAYSMAHYPGGSSSGSAVAVAAGLVPMAVGFDGGGSVRLPAAMSGAVGLATTFGRVPFGGEGATSTVIKAGPIAATVADAALAHLLLGAPLKASLYNRLYDGDVRGVPPPSLRLAHGGTLDGSLKGVRLGVFEAHFADADREVVAAARAALDAMRERGAEIVPIEIPHLREMSLAHAAKILSEFSLWWDNKFTSVNHTLEPNTAITVALGKQLSALEVLAGERVRALAIEIFRERLFTRHSLDAIVTPSIAITVPRMPDDVTDCGENNSPLVYATMKCKRGFGRFDT